MVDGQFSDASNQSEDLDVIDAVESCFNQYQKGSDDFNKDVDESSDVKSNNIFDFYDVNMMTKLEKKLNRTVRKLKRKSKKFKELKRKLYKCRKPFKPRTINTLGGKRYLCKICKFAAKSWGKCSGHIAEFHTKKSKNCDFCMFKTFNPDSYNRHRKVCNIRQVDKRRQASTMQN